MHALVGARRHVAVGGVVVRERAHAVQRLQQLPLRWGLRFAFGQKCANMYVYLSIYLSIYLFIYLSIYIYIYMYVYVCINPLELLSSTPPPPESSAGARPRGAAPSAARPSLYRERVSIKKNLAMKFAAQLLIKIMLCSKLRCPKVLN